MDFKAIVAALCEAYPGVSRDDMEEWVLENLNDNTGIPSAEHGQRKRIFPASEFTRLRMAYSARDVADAS